MANNNSNSSVVPEAKEALNKFKYEVASDVAVKNIVHTTSYFFIYPFQTKMLFYFYYL